MLEALIGGDRFADDAREPNVATISMSTMSPPLSRFSCEADVDGVVNIGSGVAIPVADLITAVAPEVGRLDLVDFGALDQRPGDPESHRTLDPTAGGARMAT